MNSPEEDKKARIAAYKAEYRIKNKERIKDYLQKNAERIKEKQRAWRIANADRVKEADKIWRAANAERIKEMHREVSRAWYLKNKERVIAAARQWEKENPERKKASREKCIENKRAFDRAYRLNNPETMRVHSQNRKARKRSSGGRLSVGIVKKLIALQKGKCASCKEMLAKTGHHVDHIIPLAIGGEHSDSNVQLLCPTCNMSKGAKHPVDFMQSRGFLL